MVASLAFSSLSCLLLSALYAPTVVASEQAGQSLPQLFGREDFLGGWVMGLPGTECPSDVPVACTGIISNPACCPVNTFCKGLGEQYCCPNDSDCGVTVKNFPKCADPSWTLYKLSGLSAAYYFCCPVGQFGVLPLGSDYGGFCLTDGTSVAASRIAVKASSAKTTINVVSTRPVQTVTSISTLAGGSVTTILVVTTGQVPSSGATTVPNDDSSPASSSATNPPSSKSSLGPGPIAGIVIGGLAVIGLFLVAFLLYRRRKPAAANVAPPPSHGYAPPTHQQDMGTYPTQVKSPALSQAGTATVVGTPAPGYVNHQQGYEHWGPPPPAAGYSEVQGQNTWEGPGRAEMGPGR